MTSPLKTLYVRFEALPNGLVRGFDYASGLSGLWTPDGAPHSGDLATRCPDAYRNVRKP